MRCWRKTRVNFDDL